MPIPLEVPPRQDHSALEKLHGSATPVLRDPKLPRLLRVANALILITAIAYFLSFLGLVNARVSWIEHAWFLLVELLIITPQILPLLIILVIEARTVGTLKRHALILVLTIALIGLGQFWTTGLIAAMNHS